ncbi:MAG TPA: RNA methyltransferase [Acidimicrobiales bacterium]|nr:RNA methyltransferase [Acidimicrobiales bacterium]
MITSTANPRVKDVLRLRKRRARDETGRFVVEGRREVSRAAEAGITLDQVLYCPGLFSPGEGADTAAWGDVAVEVARPVFERLSHREGPDGVLAVARAFPTDLDRLDPGPRPLVLVVAEVEKPGNLGAMIRTAAAAGASAVVAADPVTDVFNPNVIRASQGAVFAVPLAVAAADAVLAWLRGHGIAVFAAGPRADRPYWDLPLHEPAAIVIGAEHRGLPDAWFAAADAGLRIPMPGRRGVDSLNAATAAAVVLFEAVRQRSRPGT